jgi:CubicO group peptidase (beta-lactamase class C family)
MSIRALPRRAACAAFALAGLAQAQTAAASPRVEEYRKLAEHAFERFRPIGLALAVIEDGELVLELGLGERTVGSGEPILPGTPFNIASCSKAFTAACIGKLVASGRIRWDDRVVELLPEFRMADPWITAAMTVRDLLCHRCGLKTFDGDLLWYGTEYDDAQVLARLAKLPINRRFREEFGYSNVMYLAAGMIVERVSGRPWTEFVRDEFFAPLGMNGTAADHALLPADAAPAQPHVDGTRIAPFAFRAAKPAGAIWSSVHDLSAWVRMLLDEGRHEGREVLPLAVIHECLKPHTWMGGGRTPASLEDFASYGLGWFLSLQDGKKLVEHDGGMPGFISKVTLLPADRFGLVILNNGMDGVVNLALRRAILAQRKGEDGMALIDRFAGLAAARKAQAETARQQREAARQTGTTPSLPLEQFTGRYADAALGAAEIGFDGEQLTLAVLPSMPTLSGRLSHWHRDVFRVDFPDRFLPFALIRFSLDVDGKVEGFRIDCPIEDFDFAALEFHREGT